MPHQHRYQVQMSDQATEQFMDLLADHPEAGEELEHIFDLLAIDPHGEGPAKGLVVELCSLREAGSGFVCLEDAGHDGDHNFRQWPPVGPGDPREG